MRLYKRLFVYKNRLDTNNDYLRISRESCLSDRFALNSEARVFLLTSRICRDMLSIVLDKVISLVDGLLLRSIETDAVVHVSYDSTGNIHLLHN